MWNLLDNGSEEQVPLMTIAEWLNFQQGRSQLDRERMEGIMSRIMLRFRWMGRACQVMFRRWHGTVEQRRAGESKLEVANRGLDATRRASHRDRLMLLEFQTQSQELQEEMREDVEMLQGRLAESGSQVAELKADLAAGRKLVADAKAKGAKERGQAEERLAESTRRINALRVEEADLKDALGRSQAEETRLCAEVSEFRTRWMAADVQSGLAEVERLRIKSEPSRPRD